MAVVSPPTFHEKRGLQEPQAQLNGADYRAPMARSLVKSMAYAAKQARTEAGIKQVRVAAFLDVDQSTIARFEAGRGWPEDLGRTLQAYEGAGCGAALDIGLEALRLWASADSLADEVEEFLHELDNESSDDS